VLEEVLVVAPVLSNPPVRLKHNREKINHLRGDTPGGKPLPVAEGGGLGPVAAETVARSSLRTTKTQPDMTGNMEL
jgi:hypothetical protein